MFAALVTIVITSCTQNTSQQAKINSKTVIEISLSGGGIYGGINPTTENKKTIKNNGETTIIYKSLYGSSSRQTYLIKREELENLAQFIVDNGFFNMKDVYDCSTFNLKCEDRKNRYPPAVPLIIDVTIGEMKKKVIVTVYEKGMVDYPKKLDKIVDKINKTIDMATKQ